MKFGDVLEPLARRRWLRQKHVLEKLDHSDSKLELILQLGVGIYRGLRVKCGG